MTVVANVAETLFANVPVPVNVATHVCGPNVTLITVHEAVPAGETCTASSGVPLSENTTEPVGVPPVLVTVAVNIADVGVVVSTSAVAVGTDVGGFTMTLTALDAIDSMPAIVSVIVMACVPTVNAAAGIGEVHAPVAHVCTSAGPLTPST